MDKTTAGRLAQFETWYALEMPRLYRYVSYRVADKATAEELTAAICERALADLDRYDPARGDLSGWMFGIARNVLKMHYRSGARSPERVPLDSLPGLHAPGRSPDEALELIEVMQQALRLMDHLPDKQQEAIALRFGADLSNPAIAGVMGIPPNQVGVLIHRGLKTLRDLMALDEAVDQGLVTTHDEEVGR